MPTLLRFGAWRFFFYSCDRAEPPHVHVARGRQELKLWLADLSVARAKGCSAREIADLTAVARAHRAAFQEAWDEHVGP